MGAQSTQTKRVVKKKKSASMPQPNPEGMTLNAYIPDRSISERYVNRQVHGVWDGVVAQVAMRGKKNILLMGDTGAGKTLFGEAFASRMRMNYYSLPCDVSIDASALFGRMMPTDEVGKFEWQDGPVTEVVRHGGVLNISEINFMPPKIAASLFPLLDGRRYVPLIGHKGEVVRAHDDLLIIADMNPNYRGTIELNAAFLNRFEFKIPWGYDEVVESALVHFPTTRAIAKSLREMQGTELVTPVSTNMLMEFEAICDDVELGIKFATGNFVSAFRADEQQPVSRIIELNQDNIEKDLKHYQNEKRRAAGKKVKNDDLEEIEYEFEEED